MFARCVHRRGRARRRHRKIPIRANTTMHSGQDAWLTRASLSLVPIVDSPESLHCSDRPVIESPASSLCPRILRTALFSIVLPVTRSAVRGTVFHLAQYVVAWLRRGPAHQKPALGLGVTVPSNGSANLGGSAWKGRSWNPQTTAHDRTHTCTVLYPVREYLRFV